MGDEPCDVGPIEDLDWYRAPPSLKANLQGVVRRSLPEYPLYCLPEPDPHLDALARAVDRIGSLQAEVRELTARVAELEGLVANHVGVDIPTGPGR